MEKESRLGQMVPSMMDRGLKMKYKDSATSYMLTRTGMKEILKLVKLMAGVNILSKVVKGMKGTGPKISPMVRGNKLSKTVHIIKVSLNMAKNSLTVFTSG